MTPAEAEEIAIEFADAVASKGMLERHRLGPHLKSLTPRAIRQALCMYVAQKRYQGADVLLRHTLNGENKAILEVVDSLWLFTSLFTPLSSNGLPQPESDEDGRASAALHDEFVDFILKLSPHDPRYWSKVEEVLSRH